MTELTTTEQPCPLDSLNNLVFPNSRFGKLLCSFGLVCMSTLTAPAWAQATVEYDAEYTAKANGIAATARRSLSAIDATSFHLVNRLKAEILSQTVARLEQNSKFSLVEGELQPASYSYALTGISSEAHAISYNWDAAVAISSEDDESWTLNLAGPTGDQLSHQFALRQRLMNAPDLPVGSELEFAVIDGDEIEQHRYTLLGREVLSTPMGALNTVKVARTREGSSTRSTTIWLASDWHYLLARIEQRSGSGLNIDLELSAATIAGETVVGLP